MSKTTQNNVDTQGGKGEKQDDKDRNDGPSKEKTIVLESSDEYESCCSSNGKNSSDAEKQRPRRSKRLKRWTSPLYEFCLNCPARFATVSELLKHNQDDHIEALTEEEEAEQQIARKKKKGRYSRKRDEYTFTYPKPFKCPFCNWSFSSDSGKVIHMNKYHQDDDDTSDDDSGDQSSETSDDSGNGKGVKCPLVASGDLKRKVDKIDKLSARTTLASLDEPTSARTPNASRKLTSLVKDEPSAHRRSNAILVVGCPQCPRTFPTNSGLLDHLNHIHREKAGGQKADDSIKKEDIKKVKEEDLSCTCPMCPKQYHNADYLKGHILRDHGEPKDDLFCQKCGELFKYEILLNDHRRICSVPPEEDIAIQNDHVSGTIDAHSRDNPTVFAPVNNQVLDNSIAGTVPTPSIPAPVLSRPDVVDTREVKKEPEEAQPVRDNGFVPSKPHRTKIIAVAKHANTDSQANGKDNYDDDCIIIDDDELDMPSVKKVTFFDRQSSFCPPNAKRMKNCGETGGKIGDEEKRIVKVEEDDDCMIIEDDPPPTSMQQNRSSNDPPSEDRIEKIGLPLPFGMCSRPSNYPNQLMVVWSKTLDDDLLLGCNNFPKHTILCIKDLETKVYLTSLTEEQRRLVNCSNWVTFNLNDGNGTYPLWTVITFGEGNSPTSLQNRIFQRIAEVEKLLSDHAEARGKVIHHVMRYSREGLFPLLSSSLQHNMSAYNYQS